MPNDRSLFERLERAVAPDETMPTPFDPSLLAESVIANLRRILNTRQGSAETRVDYGLPDLNDAFRIRTEAVPTIIRVVTEQVNKFEPRLKDVDVMFQLDEEYGLNMRFSVRALLVLGDGTEPVRFDTTFGDNYRVSIGS
jgi:type VI secretion system protein